MQDRFSASEVESAVESWMERTAREIIPASKFERYWSWYKAGNSSIPYDEMKLELIYKSGQQIAHEEALLAEKINIVGLDGYTTIQKVGEKYQATTRRSGHDKSITLYESLEEALEWFTCNVYAAGYRIKF